jgi:hypothetical protein
LIDPDNWCVLSDEKLEILDSRTYLELCLFTHVQVIRIAGEVGLASWPWRLGWWVGDLEEVEDDER